MQSPYDNIPEEQAKENEVLIELLRHSYGHPGEKPPVEQIQEQAVAHVLERLQVALLHDQSFSIPEALPQLLEIERHERRTVSNKKGEVVSPFKVQRRQTFEQISAVAFVALLVGSLTLVFMLAKHSSESSAFAPATTSSAVYIVNTNTIFSLKANSGQLLWKYKMDGAPYWISTPLITHGVVYTSNGSTVYALKATDGSLLWKTHLSTPISNVQPIVVGDTVYISLILNRISALKRSTGAIQWYHTLPGNKEIGMMLIVDGTIYGTMFDSDAKGATGRSYLFALAASTGAERWHVATEPIQPLDIGGPVHTISVAHGVIYAIAADLSSNTAKSYVYAFSAKNGVKLWRSVPMSVYNMSQLHAQAGIVYISGEIDIYALSDNGGALLWHHKGNIFINNTLLVTPERVSFLETTEQGDYFMTVNPITGKVESRQMLNDSYRLQNASSSNITFTMRMVLVSNDLTYIIDQSHASLSVLANQSGTRLWTYSFPDSTKGFFPSPPVLSAL